MGRETPELIEQQMAETRSALTEKVAALENQVVGTIQTATDAVSTTVEQVKSVVQDTLEGVKSTTTDIKQTVADSVQTVTAKVGSAFDLSARTRESPWPMVGGAGAVGFLAGWFLFRKDTPKPAPGLYTSAAAPMPAYAPPAYAPPPAPPRQPGWFDALLEKAGQEVARLAEQALSTATDSVRQSIETGVPKFVNHLASNLTPPAEPARPTAHRVM
jgi:ElaB/YqjD/DUF883 family membrane-anchored ribosome-binding protein